MARGQSGTPAADSNTTRCHANTTSAEQVSFAQHPGMEEVWVAHSMRNWQVGGWDTTTVHRLEVWGAHRWARGGEHTALAWRRCG